MKRMLAPSLLAICLALVLAPPGVAASSGPPMGKRYITANARFAMAQVVRATDRERAAFKTKPRILPIPSSGKAMSIPRSPMSITIGKGEMVKMDLSAEEIKAITAYITQTLSSNNLKVV